MHAVRSVFEASICRRGWAESVCAIVVVTGAHKYMSSCARCPLTGIDQSQVVLPQQQVTLQFNRPICLAQASHECVLFNLSVFTWYTWCMYLPYLSAVRCRPPVKVTFTPTTATSHKNAEVAQEFVLRQHQQ